MRKVVMSAALAVLFLGSGFVRGRPVRVLIARVAQDFHGFGLPICQFPDIGLRRIKAVGRSS